MSWEHISYIVAILDQLFPHPQIPLLHSDPYTLLISVLLSQQSTDRKVNEISPSLFQKASTPSAMILLSQEEILQIIAPCGLGPTKAKAIWTLSHQLLERHGGEVPCDLAALEALSGIGHKTASVVMVQAFQIPAFPVDTHIHRCAKRWGLSCGTNVKKTEEDLKALFKQEEWGKRHLQIIYYARAYCLARHPILARCPICKTLQEASLISPALPPSVK